MNRTERLYAIVEELRLAAPRGRTSTWLARRFEVSSRTIKRDMRGLADAGVGLIADEGRGGGYSIDRTRLLPPLSFTAQEATAIALAVGAQPDLPFLPEARTGLAKILSAMDREQRATANDIASRLWIRPQTTRSPWASVLDEAIRRRLVAHLDYVDGSDVLTQGRAVEPMAFVRTRVHWHLLAWCRLREAGRWFRMDRVRAAYLTREVAPERALDHVFGAPPSDAQPISLLG